MQFGLFGIISYQATTGRGGFSLPAVSLVTLSGGRLLLTVDLDDPGIRVSIINLTSDYQPLLLAEVHKLSSLRDRESSVGKDREMVDLIAFHIEVFFFNSHILSLLFVDGLRVSTLFCSASRTNCFNVRFVSAALTFTRVCNSSGMRIKIIFSFILMGHSRLVILRYKCLLSVFADFY
jgi:hypothetical protein